MNSRRQFIKGAAVLAAAAYVVPSVLTEAKADTTETAGIQNFMLPELPYATNALEPHIDQQTMEIHYHKHHKAYVDNLNKALVGNKAATWPLEKILPAIGKFSDAVRNNAGGHYNHSLFWHSLSPTGGGIVKGELAKAIDDAFINFDLFRDAFTKAGTDRFGSGWVWLCVNAKGKLEISSTANQDNPLMDIKGIAKGTPVLALDVWEHAYYLKHQNKRADYIRAFWNVVNWAEAERRYQAALLLVK